MRFSVYVIIGLMVMLLILSGLCTDDSLNPIMPDCETCLPPSCPVPTQCESPTLCPIPSCSPPTDPDPTGCPTPEPPDDTTGPYISSINVDESFSTALITFNTDELAKASINYGLSTAYGLQENAPDEWKTNHQISLTGLSGDTEYHFEMVVYDTFNNTTVLSDLIFQTAYQEDTTPPSSITDLSLPQLSPPGGTTIKISSTELNLSWTPNGDVDFSRYLIYRDTHPGVDNTKTLVGTVENQATGSFTDTLYDVSYYYFVIYVEDENNNVSTASNEVSCVRYPIGNVFKMMENTILTGQYPDPASSGHPIFYPRPRFFIFVDAKNEGNGGLNPLLKLSSNFQLYEFVWNTGRAHTWDDPEPDTFGYTVIDPSAVQHLQNIREDYAAPLYINSAQRSPTHNASIGGATYSRHLYGDAFDIAVTDQNMWDIIADAAGAGYLFNSPGEGANYIEPYSMTGTWVHMDWRYERNFSYLNARLKTQGIQMGD